MTEKQLNGGSVLSELLLSTRIFGSARQCSVDRFDTDLAALHRQKTDLAMRQEAMQADLRKKLSMSAPTLLLARKVRSEGVADVIEVETIRLVKIRNTYMVQSGTKLDYAILDKSRRLVPISESKNGKSYAYNHWTALGNQADRLEEEMMTAQRRAFDKLRDIVSHLCQLIGNASGYTAENQVVEQSEDIQRNAGLVDELDLCLSFAQTAEEHGHVRPILDDT